MKKRLSGIFLIVALVIVIFLGLLAYLNQLPRPNQPPPASPPQIQTPMQTQIPQTQTPVVLQMYTYPKFYPEELAFDMSRIESISETKDANGNNLVTVQFTSTNPLTGFSSLVKQILELKKWTITQGKTEDTPQVVVATRGSETVTVDMSQSGSGTVVKINYRQ
jgi:hypothetical protein